MRRIEEVRGGDFTNLVTQREPGELANLAVGRRIEVLPLMGG
jgi:hypothetical protein